MGIASLILGIVGLLVSLTIFKDFSLILCVVGIVLGVISIVKKKSKGMAIAGVVLSAIGLVLCFAVDTDTNTSSTGITNDSGKGTKTVQVETDKVKIEKVGFTKAGDLVAKVTNNNKGSVCLDTITANFKDSNGNFALKKDAFNYFVVIPAKGSTYVYFWGGDEDITQYEDVTFNSSLAYNNKDYAVSGITLTSNNTGSQIAVTLKNESGKDIMSSNVIVVYYNGNEVVGVADGFDDSKVPNGGEGYINVDYPVDSNYDEVAFDKYEVYYINASFNY